MASRSTGVDRQIPTALRRLRDWRVVAFIVTILLVGTVVAARWPFGSHSGPGAAVVQATPGVSVSGSRATSSGSAQSSATANASGTSTASPTATASGKSTASATASQGISPTQGPTRPTQGPTHRPTASPPSVAVIPSGLVAGYGRATVGGAGGRVIQVRSIGELTAALSASGSRRVRLVGGGVWDANGAEIRISNPYITVDGSACTCQIKDGWIKVAASQVILRYLRVRTGDGSVLAVDADAISINGGTVGISHVVLDHVEAIWGPDIGGVAILNRVSDVTVQNSIMGEGLYLSRHPGGIAADLGHSYGFNITTLDGPSVAQRVTVYHNLITTSSQRNPQIIGAVAVDVVNNVIYNAGLDWAYGNPRSVNMVNNLYRAGPETATTDEWRSRTNPHITKFFPGSVYLAGNVADGFSFTRDVQNGVLAASAPVPLSVRPESVTGLLGRILASVGPRPADATTQRLLNNARNRTGVFRNGLGKPPPNPTWP